ncbi:hypothetical protein QJS66_23310 (plasmid) [Kocuria rhizophila]|nr:hypothetical protein QJS66_23310 [Kocuria rhizophila]
MAPHHTDPGRSPSTRRGEIPSSALPAPWTRARSATTTDDLGHLEATIRLRAPTWAWTGWAPAGHEPGHHAEENDLLDVQVTYRRRRGADDARALLRRPPPTIWTPALNRSATPRA